MRIFSWTRPDHVQRFLKTFEDAPEFLNMSSLAFSSHWSPPSKIHIALPCRAMWIMGNRLHYNYGQMLHYNYSIWWHFEKLTVCRFLRLNYPQFLSSFTFIFIGSPHRRACVQGMSCTSVSSRVWKCHANFYFSIILWSRWGFITGTVS